MNREFERVLGWSAEDANRNDFLTMAYPDASYRKAAVEYMQSMLSGWREWNVRAKDASTVPIEWANVHLSDGRAIGIGIDLRARKAAEEALRLSQSEYRDLVQNANSAIVRWRSDGTISFFNEYAQSFFGYSASEAIGQPVSMLLPRGGKTGTEIATLTDDIVADPQRYANHVNENVCRDGRRVWMTWTNRPILDENGNVSEILAVGTDITERIRAEERVRQHNTVLEGINRIFSGALICNTEEELGLICLALAEELTDSKIGFVGELNDKGVLEYVAISDSVWKERRDVFSAIFDRIQTGGKGLYSNEPGELPSPAAWLAVPLKHADKVIGLIAVGNRPGGYREQDLEISEALAPAVVQVLMRQKAEMAVRAGEERLRQAQKMESIGILAGGLAHDFNNLLVGVIGNASLAEDLLPPGHPATEMMHRIIQAGEQAAHLTKQMLAYSGKGRFVMEPVDLTAVVREVTDLVQSTIPKKVAIQLDLQPGLPAIEADRGQMHQVLMNLVINATEAIGSGAGLITVRTGVRQVGEAEIRVATGVEIGPGKYVYLEVSDTGFGMDEATSARIFDPFFTTKFQGRGLGLAAVAGIIRSHKGAITVQTAPGRGTTFIALLPAMQSGARGAAHEARSQAGGGPESGTVLVVDDEAIVREVARVSLERRGYSVISAASGADAVETLRQFADRVTVVLLDLNMPEIGGVEALPKLLAIKPELNVIISSGYTEGQVMRLFAGCRIAGFLQKPYTMDELAKKVKAATAQS